MLELYADTIFINNHCIPGINYGANPVKNRRWIDSHNSIHIGVGNKFGLEGGGGLPTVYSFHDQSKVTEYPWIGHSITIDDSFIAGNGRGHSNGGFIVLKRGLPQRITIENNGHAQDVPFIRTDLMEKADGSATTLTAYLATAFTGTEEKAFSFKLLNKGRGNPVTQSAADTALLAPFTDYDNGDSLDKINYMNRVATRRSDTNILIGKNFVTTSVVGAVAVVDTGITAADADFGWSVANGFFSMMEMMVSGNPNAAASGSYHHGILGYISVGSEFRSGPGAAHVIEYKETYKPAFISQFLSVAVVFWDGSTESAVVPFGSTAQIRIKVTYTTTSNVGNSQRVRLIRKNMLN
jgi:hypothetical protein